MWTQWRMAYTTEYEALVASGDGDEGTQNIISQMRTVFTLEDPYQGSTLMQEEAYRDLERLSCKDVKDIIKFLNDYLHLATRTGRLFVREELSEKLWTKMPGDLGERIKKAFSERYPGNMATEEIEEPAIGLSQSTGKAAGISESNPPVRRLIAAEAAERGAGGTSEEHLHAFTIAQGEVKEKKKNMLYNITVEIYHD